MLSQVVKHEDLVPRALELATQWATQNKPKNFAQGHGTVDEYVQVRAFIYIQADESNVG